MTTQIDAEVFMFIVGGLTVAVVALAGYVVRLHGQLTKQMGARMEDLRSHSAEAQSTLTNSFQALHDATEATEGLQDAVCTLIEDVRELRPRRR